MLTFKVVEKVLDDIEEDEYEKEQCQVQIEIQKVAEDEEIKAIVCKKLLGSTLLFNQWFKTLKATF